MSVTPNFSWAPPIGKDTHLRTSMGLSGLNQGDWVLLGLGLPALANLPYPYTWACGLTALPLLNGVVGGLALIWLI